MVVRMKLVIEQDEYSALLRLARGELRNPESQLHFILRKELKRNGLISDKPVSHDPRKSKNESLGSQEVKHA